MVKFFFDKIVVLNKKKQIELIPNGIKNIKNSKKKNSQKKIDNRHGI